MDENKLTPLDVARRDHERNELRREQQKEMNFNRVSKKQNDWNQSIAAASDHYMTDALKQVRQQNHITHDEKILRMNGNWFHHQSRIKD